MNDDEVIAAVREQRGRVHSHTPVDQIISRGRAIRARRRIPGAASGLAVAAGGWLAPAAAAVAVIAVVAGSLAISGAIGRQHHGALGARTAPTVYAAYTSGGAHACAGTVIPVSTATNTAGKPIRTGEGNQIAITPGGKTAYVLNACAGTVIPVSTATNTAGKPIHVARSRVGWPQFMAITPDAKTVYVADTAQNTVVPVSTATNTAGKPIHVGPGPVGIAITPDAKTAYVVSQAPNGHGVVTPISTATNTAGTPIPVAGPSFAIAITPNGKTVYADSGSSVTPVSTATNKAGNPIRLHGNPGEGLIAITPDGKTAYVLTMNPRTVVPISTATNTAGTPIKVFLAPWQNPLGGIIGIHQFAITPDGKTAYLLTGFDSVIPISTATNTAWGKPIQFGADCRLRQFYAPNNSIAIAPDGKTAYVACNTAVVPISTATNTPGKPIPVPLRRPDDTDIAITP